MSEMTKRTVRKNKKPLAVVASLAVGVLILGACSTQIRAERKGKQYGQAICDVKNSSNADEAQRNANQAQRKADDLARIIGRPINEDAGDINQNMTDLIEHVRQGNTVLAQQDISAIQRNFQAVGRTLTGKARAAYDGIQEGLADCE